MPAPARLVSVLSLLLALPVGAQIVPVGSGSYSLTRPAGGVGPQNANGQPVRPKVSARFGQPVQTNDWWSSLLYPFFGDAYSNVLYAHPVNARATDRGLEIGHTARSVFAAADYLYPYRAGLAVGVDGMAASRATAERYGDWTVTAAWDDGPRTLRATLGHGLPYVYFRTGGGDATLRPTSAPAVWYDQDGTLGLTIDGVSYGVFAPTGSTWTGTGTRTSSLNGADYLTVAVLPDDRPETLALFRQHAFAFVTDSRVTWDYDPASARVTSTYAYETEALEGTSRETLTALYRHQWLDATTPTTGHTYASPRGEMRLAQGASFTTERTFTGVLPALPDRGDYNRSDLLTLVQQAAAEPLGPGPSYENGKAMGRVARLVHIADQLGADAERDQLLGKLKTRLEDWFTAGGAQEYVYDETWDALTGYPSGYGADNQLNDHHFHASYAISGAATVAQYDPAWAAPERWGGMVNLLVKDANNWDRADDRFPFLRTFDAYAGHSWAAGHGDFGDGNNQESSSESMHFASAVVLWGEATGQAEVRDLGVYLYATEAAAIDQYWFDVDGEVFPDGYPHVAIGMVWGSKGVHSTWFGADPEFIHGINLLPITAGSLYLGRDPAYVRANYDEVVAERNGPPVVWKDVLWEYLALGDASRALALYLADRDYQPFDGESRAHTMHWLYNLKAIGQVATDVTADVPTYAAFRDADGERTYVAYNAGATARTVTFSDGFTLEVAPRTLASDGTKARDPDAPVALLLADVTEGKSPLAVAFEGSRSYDPNGGALGYAWDFGDGRTSTDADPAVTFTEVGIHVVTLTVTTPQGRTASETVEINVIGNGAPFSGTPVRLPGVIEAENYDLGGEGAAYHDAEADNIGLAYRPDEGVDLEPASTGGFDVYWITDGEWIEYTVRVAEAGRFAFTPSVSSVPGFGTLRLKVDNEPLGPAQAVLGTGGWQTWAPLPFPAVDLEAGTHILRLEAASDSDKTGWLFSVNSIAAERVRGVATDAGADAGGLRLEPSRPNPASATTRLAYALPSASDATVEVFNALGQRVAVLADGPHGAGPHALDLDVSRLPAGVYVVRLRTPAASQTQRLAVVR